MFHVNKSICICHIWAVGCKLLWFHKFLCMWVPSLHVFLHSTHTSHAHMVLLVMLLLLIIFLLLKIGNPVHFNPIPDRVVQGSFSNFWVFIFGFLDILCSIVAMIYFHLNKTQKFAIHVLRYSVLQFIKSAIADSVCGWHFIKMSLHHIVIFVTGFYFMERTLFIFFFFLFWFSLSMTFRLFAEVFNQKISEIVFMNSFPYQRMWNSRIIYINTDSRTEKNPFYILIFGYSRLRYQFVSLVWKSYWVGRP